MHAPHASTLLGGEVVETGFLSIITLAVLKLAVLQISCQALSEKPKAPDS